MSFEKGNCIFVSAQVKKFFIRGNSTFLKVM